MSAVMAESLAVPIKDVEISLDDNASQTKIFFLDISLLFYISHYLKHVVYQ